MRIKRWIFIVGTIVSLIGFVYFYDFNKNGHALKIENHSDNNITIVKIINDDKEIMLPIGKSKLESKPNDKNYSHHWSDGGCDILTSGRYKPGTLQITIRNVLGEIKTASCILKRSEKMLHSSASEFIVQYVGDEKLICTNVYFEEAACDIDPREGIQIINKEKINQILKDKK